LVDGEYGAGGNAAQQLQVERRLAVGSHPDAETDQRSTEQLYNYSTRSSRVHQEYVKVVRLVRGSGRQKSPSEVQRRSPRGGEGGALRS